MSFIGTLVVWRGDGDGRPPIGRDYEVDRYQVRGDWTVSFVDAELVGQDARPLLSELCHATQAPAIAGFVFESDSIWVSGQDPADTFWSSCLVRDVIAGIDAMVEGASALSDVEMKHRYGTPEDGARAAASWSRAAGLEPNVAALQEVFEIRYSEEVFFGPKIFDRLLSALGLPESQTPAFYEDAPVIATPSKTSPMAQAARVVARTSPLVIDGLGQFEVETASDSVIYIRLPETVAGALSGGAGFARFARRVGLGQGRELPRLPADRTWVQASQAAAVESVLVMRREDGPEHAAFFFLGELAPSARKMARGPFGVQIFLVVDERPLTEVLSSHAPFGRITHPQMWGALVSGTPDA